MVSPILFRLGFRFADKNFNCRTRDVSHARTRADIYKYINARARAQGESLLGSAINETRVPRRDFGFGLRPNLAREQMSKCQPESEMPPVGSGAYALAVKVGTRKNL